MLITNGLMAKSGKYMLTKNFFGVGLNLVSGKKNSLDLHRRFSINSIGLGDYYLHNL